MKLGSLNSTLPKVSKKKLFKLSGVHGVKKIEIHQDYSPADPQSPGSRPFNDLAIITLTKPFVFEKFETEKGKLQSKSYHTKSKVQSNLVIVNIFYI